QIAESFYDRVDGRAFLDGVFVVGLGVDFLRFVRYEVFEQLHGLVPVRRVSGDRGAGDVHVRAAVLERRQDDLDRVAPPFLLGRAAAAAHQSHVIRIADADVADAAHDVARDVTVATGRGAGQVFLHAAEPFFGRGFTVVHDVRADQRRVVRVLTGAGTQRVAPFLVIELLVVERVDVELLGRIDDPSAHRQRVPVPVLAPQVRGHGGVQHVG